MATLSSRSTDGEVLATYNDNSSYEEDGSRAKAADSAEKGNHFSGVKVASQLVAERGEGRVVDVGSRRGTGIPRTWQRWTAAAGSNS